MTDDDTPFSLRVLVVDDEDTARRLLEQAVRALGHVCQSAADGEEAWSVIEKEHFDVVVTDWRMPRLDGLSLCKRIRERAQGAYTYVIFVTGLDDRPHFVEATESGADDYLAKPVDLLELEARLRSAARVLALHRSLTSTNARLRRESERVHAAARVDALTGAGNRLRLDEDLASCRARVDRYAHAFAVAMCDLDLFKRYNDRHGHLAGDDLLRRVAETMRAVLRDGDEVYRYGGEEFVVLLPEQTLDEARAAMERLRVVVEKLAMPGGVTISVGVSSLTPGTTPAEALAAADAALYRAKAQGRNRVELAAQAGRS